MEKNRSTIDQVCDPVECTGCGACSYACKFGALTMIEDAEGFINPSILSGLCTGCGACRKICPSLRDMPTFEGDSFMAWNRDSSVLKRCSSGGVFDALACYVLERGGVVYGAVMDPATRELRHSRAESLGELDGLRRSKYFQSDAREAFEEAIEFLKAGRWVLFSGTACQIAGLLVLVNSSAGYETSRLITMDVLCHGVTNKRVVDAYVASKEEDAGAPIVALTFRRKHGELGWAKGNSTITVTTHLRPDNTTYELMDKVDMRGTFFAGFNRNVFLRESCYHCRYCGMKRIADFTAADYWGLSPEKVTEWQYWHGVSLLLINTDKAHALMPELNSWLHYEPIDRGEAVPHNRSLERPNDRPVLRDSFFKDLNHNSYDALIRKYYGREIAIGNIKRKIRKALGNGVYEALKKLVGR